MRALVTGGAGFIGHHLVAALVAQDHDVVVLDDFSSGDPSRLRPWEHRIRVVEGSVVDAAVLDEAIRGCEVIFHQAAIASVVRSLAEPRLTADVNVGGTVEVTLAAARHGVRRVLLAGTSAVYGASGILPSREDQVPNPQSPYGASKLAAEHMLHTLGSARGVETVALRYFNVYGPGQDPTSGYAAVIPNFMTAVLQRRRPVINGSDDISRDFVHIDDVVAANLLAAGQSAPSGLTCNIASGHRTTLRQLLDTINGAVGWQVEPILGPRRSGDIAHSQADISLARDVLGYQPVISLAEGLARTIAWFRTHDPGGSVGGEPR